MPASGRATLTCVRALLPLLVVVLAVAGCSIAPSGPSGHVVDRGLEAPQRLQVQVLEVRPHDRSAFTQGFELAEGVLYESTGQIGRSAILATDPETGAVRQRIDLPEPLFGEGITVVGQRIWQLTWRDGVAIERDTATLAELRRVSYPGQGWGLCYDGARLVMSDGTDRLVFRDPSSFAPVGEVRVRLADGGVGQLNELECAGGSVWANVWQTDRILRIDPTSGLVTAVVDAGGLLARRTDADVLNGIAALPGGAEFLITGKLWPHTFRVKFVPA
jgi:glutaminyl-peptide cyclotransferase